jgi:alpha-L-fucosidase
MRRYEADWDSLKKASVPEWYQNGKFGIFIHWGLYSLPAFGNEWYPRNMYQQGTKEFKHHVAAWGSQDRFGYKDFIPLFKADKYDPTHWARLFKQSGAKYVVPVAEHHDGFAMYDSTLSRWTAAKMGPKRDLIGELAAAVRAQGLVFGVSSHRAEHWWFMNGGMQFDSDVQNPQFYDFYGPATPITSQSGKLDDQPRPNVGYLKDWLARCCELVDKYQPQLFWFDWWIEQLAFEPYLRQFAAYYYNRGLEWGRGVAINYKNEAFPTGAGVYDIERGQLSEIRPYFWQTDTAISKNSWGYITDQDYKTPTAIIHDLVDIVSKNGSLLLNIGPRPDGTIPGAEEAILLEIGRWLAANGEAIYGTRPYHIYGEGPTEVVAGGFNDTKRTAFTSRDIRFTRKGNVLYAILLDWPGAQVLVQSLGSNAVQTDNIQRITLLGSPANLHWSQNGRGLYVEMPLEKPCDHAYVLRIDLKDSGN